MVSDLKKKNTNKGFKIVAQKKNCSWANFTFLPASPPWANFASLPASLVKFCPNEQDFLYKCFNAYRSKDSLSPVCRIFFVIYDLNDLKVTTSIKICKKWEEKKINHLNCPIHEMLQKTRHFCVVLSHSFWKYVHWTVKEGFQQQQIFWKSKLAGGGVI